MPWLNAIMRQAIRMQVLGQLDPYPSTSLRGRVFRWLSEVEASVIDEVEASFYFSLTLNLRMEETCLLPSIACNLACSA